jgi:hypothetical protein
MEIIFTWRLLGRPRRRRENKIEIDVEEMVSEDVDWIHAAQVAVSCEHDNEPLGSRKGGTFVDQLGDNQLSKDSVPWNLL